MPTLSKDADDSEHVVAPRTGALFGQVVEIKLEVDGKFFRAHYELAIRPLGDCHICRKTDGGGHYETVVVVGVFADQVDATGSAEHPGMITEEFLKVLNEFVCLHCTVTQESTIR